MYQWINRGWQNVKMRLNYTRLHIVNYKFCLRSMTFRSMKMWQGQWDGSEDEDVVKPDNLSLIPGTHMLEGENWLPQVVLWPQILVPPPSNVFLNAGTVFFYRQRF